MTSKKTERSLNGFQWVTEQGSSILGAGFYYNKSQTAYNRCNPFYGALYLLEGGGVYEDEKNGRIRIAKDNILILFPNLKFSYYKLDFNIWSEYYLVFQGEAFNQLERERVIERTRPVLFPGNVPSLRAAFELLANDYLKRRFHSHAVAAGRIHTLLAEAAYYHKLKEGDKLIDFVLASTALLEKNLEQEINLNSIAKSLHLSLVHFRRLFTENVGLSPVQYRIHRKIELAQSLLSDKGSVKDVARQLGYCNLNFFYRQFKQVTGHTPQSRNS